MQNSMKQAGNNSELRKKILVIDDEVELLVVVRELIESAGYRVLCAENGAEGIRIAMRERPDLIILDLRMPGMDGMETLRQLRGFDSHVRIVILTAFRDMESTRNAEHMDISACIGKPFENEHFLNVIRSVIGKPD
jgi:two-component system, response regulator, stage 0 sporulation protein F